MTRFIIISLCAMSILVPLAIWRGLYEHEMLPKLLTLHLCMTACCVGWLWHRVARVPSGLVIPALCLMGAGLVASWGATQPRAVLVSLSGLVSLFILTLVVASVPLDHLRPVWWCLVATGGLVSVIGILQWMGVKFGIPENGPVGSTFANRNLLAEFLVCCIPTGCYLFLNTKHRTYRWFSFCATGLMGVALTLTGCRAAFLGLGVGVTWFIWKATGRRIEVVLTSIALIICIVTINPPELRNPNDTSIIERMAFWRGTMEMIADHPFGVGPGMWLSSYPPYDHGATITTQGYHRRPHNDYLWIAAEYGILGLAAYLWLLWRTYVGLQRMEDKGLSASLTAGLIALSVVALFGFPKEQPATTMFQFIAIGVACGAMSARQVRGCMIPTLAFLFCVGLLCLTGCRIVFDRAYLIAFSACKYGKWAVVLDTSMVARRWGIYDPDLLYFEGLALENVRQTVRAERVYAEGLRMSPHAWYLHARIANLQAIRGDTVSAMRHADIAYRICPSLLHGIDGQGRTQRANHQR